jgi:hypothetical protein
MALSNASCKLLKDQYPTRGHPRNSLAFFDDRSTTAVLIERGIEHHRNSAQDCDETMVTRVGALRDRHALSRRRASPAEVRARLSSPIWNTCIMNGTESTSSNHSDTVSSIIEGAKGLITANTSSAAHGFMSCWSARPRNKQPASVRSPLMAASVNLAFAVDADCRHQHQSAGHVDAAPSDDRGLPVQPAFGIRHLARRD